MDEMITQIESSQADSDRLDSLQEIADKLQTENRKMATQHKSELDKVNKKYNR